MSAGAKKYQFANGGSCAVKPGSALHAVIHKFVSEGFTYRKTERYTPGTFTLWKLAGGEIEVHRHGPGDLFHNEKVIDLIERERYRKRITAEVEELEDDDGELTDAQLERREERLEEHRAWLEENPVPLPGVDS